jgi:hypothetical protein
MPTHQFAVTDVNAALAQRLFPTVLAWNRLEGRPRRPDRFDRAMRAEIRDALWMLTRQWQLGEFEGDDAGSPVSAQVLLEMQPLTKYQPRDHPPRAFRQDAPLEALVERRTVPFHQGSQIISLDLRLLMGRQWLKMVAPLGEFAAFYRNEYGIAAPDPENENDSQVCAHSEVWQQFAAVAGRAMDGYRFYRHLVGGQRASANLTAPAPVAAQVDELGASFVTWFQRLFHQPEPDQDAWQPAALEYRFRCAAAGNRGEQSLTAEEYYHGSLDWYHFDRDRSVLPEVEGSDGEAPAVSSFVRETFIPVVITFDGMPNTRWWTFEDGKTNLGALLPNKTDLGKLLLVEFGVVYANDWFLLPLDVLSGQTLLVKGLSVTNVFGERTWIEPASGHGIEPSQRWRMFTLHPREAGREPEDLSLLLLPTAPKVQEGPPTDEVLLLRDEVANMVWGVERVVPLATGRSKSGFEAATELRRFHLRRVEVNPNQDHPEYEAAIRYQVMNSVPENWIPFIPVHEPGEHRQIRLQRAALPRILPGDSEAPRAVRPRSLLLREGVDAGASYFLHEEEVPRAGVIVSHRYQRTRWLGGRVFTWLGIRKITGRGEGHSGLAFDQIVPTGRPPET